MEGSFEADGCRLSYWLDGEPRAPLVVLAPGAFTDHRVFDDQMPALLPEFRVLRWDMRGHGRSRPAGKPFTTRRAAEDLIGLLDHLGEGRAALIGQSLGGYVCQEVVFGWPARVTAAIFLGCTCATMALTGRERLLLRLTPPLTALYPMALFKRHAMARATIREDVRERLTAMAAPLGRDEVLDITRGIAAAIHAEPGYTIPHPILIAHGDADRLGSVRAGARAWHHRDRMSSYAVVPDAGHVANMDNPAAFNTLAVAFLRTHMRAA